MPSSTKVRSSSSDVDAYISKAPEYARPILSRIRKVFHQGCPQIEETIKWGCPHFEYKGLLGGMAAFKHHVGFGFWKTKLLSDPHGLFKRSDAASMCTVKVTSVKDLPAHKVLVSYVKEAARLNELGVKASPAKDTRKPLRTPAVLKAALAKNKKANSTFQSFSPSNKRDYVEWITEAKTDATRQRRLKQAIAWMAEGKPRNWKYLPAKKATKKSPATKRGSRTRTSKNRVAKKR